MHFGKPPHPPSKSRCDAQIDVGHEVHDFRVWQAAALRGFKDEGVSTLWLADVADGNLVGTAQRGSMNDLLFVGEKPSRLAEQNGLTWEDGRLAAKSLFDALEAAGIGRHRCSFFNLFGATADAPENGPTVDANVARVIEMAEGRVVVAMGTKVARHLDRHGVPHRKLIHPAARGKIRSKARYAAHVAETLL